MMMMDGARMEDAILLARIFGPVLALIGLWAVFKTDELLTFWSSMKASPAIFYIGGLVNLIIGFTILVLYSAWVWDWTVLVTLFGYVHVLRGLLVFFCHDWLLRFTNKVLKSSIMRGIALIPLAWGIALVGYGYNLIAS